MLNKKLVNLVLLLSIVKQLQPINNPGTYILGIDIIYTPTEPGTAAVIIEANDVILDLAGHSISQSDATAFTHGVEIKPNFSNVTIKNGTIKGVTGAGILVDDGCMNIDIDNILTISCDVTGIVFVGTPENPISKSSVSYCQTFSCSAGSSEPIAFAMYFTNCSELLITECNIESNQNGGVFAPFYANQCERCSFQRIRVKNNISNSIIAGFATIDGSNNVFESCSSVGNSSTAGTDTFGAGFLISGGSFEKNVFLNCLALQNFGAAQMAGFFFDGNPIDVHLQNCLSLQNTGTLQGFGYYINQSLTRSNFIDCIAEGNSVDDMISGTAAGFFLSNATDVKLIGCIANDQTGGVSVGFDLVNSLSCVHQNCQAYRNEGSSDDNSFGFRINGDTGLPDTGVNIFISNKAANNGGIATNQMNNFIAGTVNNINYSSLNSVTSPFTNLGIVP